MKAFLIVLFIALLCAVVTADYSNQGGICDPAPFTLTFDAPQNIVVPGLLNLYVGYQVSVSGLSSSANVTLTDITVDFSAGCSGGSIVNFTVPLPDNSYAIPANSNSSYWNPADLWLSGFQTGPMTTDDICGSDKGYSIFRATFTGGLLSSDASSPVSMRFTYFTFVDLSSNYSQPFDSSDIAMWYGNSAYCSAQSIQPNVCLSQSASTTPSATKLN